MLRVGVLMTGWIRQGADRRGVPHPAVGTLDALVGRFGAPKSGGRSARSAARSS